MLTTSFGERPILPFGENQANIKRMTDNWSSFSNDTITIRKLNDCNQ